VAPPLLVIAGRPGWKTEALQQRIRTHPQAGKQVIWFEDASDELLVALYDACTAVVVASRGEGFGLPLIEAALYGKPIIARDLPAFREHNMPDVDYFHGDSPAALAQAIESTLRKQRFSKQAPIVVPTWEASAAELKKSLSLPASPVQRLAA
jgi:glycosyltransferase involved in cell wall biosynthesis